MNNGNNRSGVYTVKPDNGSPFNVFCDLTTAGGGWTVFQKRLDGSVDFYRGWNDYRAGFGDLSGEFWLGLDKIYRLTAARPNKLRVDLAETNSNTAYAQYSSFAVSAASNKYRLSLGSYSGESRIVLVWVDLWSWSVSLGSYSGGSWTVLGLVSGTRGWVLNHTQLSVGSYSSESQMVLVKLYRGKLVRVMEHRGRGNSWRFERASRSPEHHSDTVGCARLAILARKQSASLYSSSQPRSNLYHLSPLYQVIKMLWLQNQ